METIREEIDALPKEIKDIGINVVLGTIKHLNDVTGDPFIHALPVTKEFLKVCIELGLAEENDGGFSLTEKGLERVNEEGFGSTLVRDLMA